MCWLLSVRVVLDDLHVQRAQTGYLGIEGVADLGPDASAKAHTGGSTSEDDITRFKGDVLANAGDLFGDGPDHVLGAGILLELAVQAELQLQVVLMDEAGRHDGGP